MHGETVAQNDVSQASEPYGADGLSSGDPARIAYSLSETRSAINYTACNNVDVTAAWFAAIGFAERCIAVVGIFHCVGSAPVVRLIVRIAWLEDFFG